MLRSLSSEGCLLYTIFFFSSIKSFFSHPCALLTDSNSQQSALNECRICNTSYYLNEEGLTNTNYFPSTACVSRSGAMKETFFVTDTDKCENSCSGNRTNPFPNIVFALEKITNLTLRLLSAEITLILLEKSHYILEKDFSQRNNLNIQYFRRQNIRLFVYPNNCQDNLSLCDMGNARATIFIKTDRFSFFISSQFTVVNITFDASDLEFTLLFSALPSCLLERRKCLCGQEVLCPLLQNNYAVKADNTANNVQNRYSGLFNVEGFFDNQTIQAELLLKGCEFKNFTAPKYQTGFSSLLTAFDFGGLIKAEKCSFENLFFKEGILSQNTWKEDILYNGAQLNITEKALQLSLSEISIKNYNIRRFYYETIDISFLFNFSLNSLSINIINLQLQYIDSAKKLGLFKVSSGAIFIQNLMAWNTNNFLLIILQAGSFAVNGFNSSDLKLTNEIFIKNTKESSFKIENWTCRKCYLFKAFDFTISKSSNNVDDCHTAWKSQLMTTIMMIKVDQIAKTFFHFVFHKKCLDS